MRFACSLVPALALALLAPSLAAAQTSGQMCIGAAPQVSWTLATVLPNGNPDEIAASELQNVIGVAECECDTMDLRLIGRVTKASTQNVTPTVWTGSTCNSATSRVSSCESVPSTVVSTSFYSGAGAASAPAQLVPVRALIQPTVGSMMGHSCAPTASIAGNLWILFGSSGDIPDYCVIPLAAKTTLPDAPLNLGGTSGDGAVTLTWNPPAVGTTTEAPAYYQVLCADDNGDPLPKEGAYGHGDATTPPHQLGYSTCIDPASHQIQRRFFASVGTQATQDGGTTTTPADLGTGSASPLGTDNAPNRGDDTGSHGGGGPISAPGDDLGTPDMSMASTAPPDLGLASECSGTQVLTTLDRKFVCSDKLMAVGSQNTLRITSLTNGGRYHFRVVSIDKFGNANPSAEVCATPQPVEDLYRRFLDEGGRTQGFCFIATAAYGSYQHPYVQVLRDFRDEVLLPTDTGSAFVAWYYRTSPPLADWIRERPSARFGVRVLLWPVIAFAWLWLVLGGFVTLSLLAGLAIAIRRRKRIAAWLRGRTGASDVPAVGAAAERGAA